MATDILDQHTDGMATRLKLAEETAHMGWRLAKDRGVQLEEMRKWGDDAIKSRDNLQDIVREVARIAQRDQNKETVAGAVERLVKQLADMKQSRDDAVAAAHLMHKP